MCLWDGCFERIGATTVMYAYTVRAPQLWQVEPCSIPSSFVDYKFLCFDDGLALFFISCHISYSSGLRRCEAETVSLEVCYSLYCIKDWKLLRLNVKTK